MRNPHFLKGLTTVSWEKRGVTTPTGHLMCVTMSHLMSVRVVCASPCPTRTQRWCVLAGTTFISSWRVTFFLYRPAKRPVRTHLQTLPQLHRPVSARESLKAALGRGAEAHCSLSEESLFLRRNTAVITGGLPAADSVSQYITFPHCAECDSLADMRPPPLLPQ